MTEAQAAELLGLTRLLVELVTLLLLVQGAWLGYVLFSQVLPPKRYITPKV